MSILGPQTQEPPRHELKLQYGRWVYLQEYDGFYFGRPVRIQRKEVVTPDDALGLMEKNPDLVVCE